MWKEYFDKQQTSKQTFHLTADKSVETDFMFQVKYFKRGDTNIFKNIYFEILMLILSQQMNPTEIDHRTPWE